MPTRYSTTDIATRFPNQMNIRNAALRDKSAAKVLGKQAR